MIYLCCIIESKSHSLTRLVFMLVDLCLLPLLDPLSEAGDVLTRIDQTNAAESLLAANQSVI